MIPISPSLAREIFFIELWHFGALICTIVLNALLYRSAENSLLLRRYLVLQGALLLWIVAKMLKTVAPNEALRWGMIVLQYLGVTFLGTFFFEFAWAFRFSSRVPGRLLALLYALSALYLLAVATNPMHHLIYSYYDFFRDVHGPLFFLCSFFTYAQILVAVVLCVLGVIRRQNGMNGVLIVLAALLPLVINWLYVYRYIRPLFDITPLVMTGSLSLFGLGALKFNFLSPLPVARSVLLDTLGDPLLVTDSHDRVILAHIFPVHTRPAEQITQGERTYRLYAVKELGRRRLRLYSDISALVTLREQISSENRLLESSIASIDVKNRSRLRLVEHDFILESRRSLHDILGHSLTLSLFLLRSRMLQSDDPFVDAVTRTECRLLVERGLQNLEKDLTGTTDSGSVLSIALQQVTESLSNMDVDLDICFGGTEHPISRERVQLLCDIVREATTNSIRHGGFFTKIMISVLFSSRDVLLSVGDTGKGCDECVPGNGLRMMESSVRATGGSLRIASELGQGFQLTVRIPYNVEALPETQ